MSTLASVKREHKTYRDKVLYLLEIFPEARNSDKTLYKKCLEIFSPYRIINLQTIIEKIPQILTSFDIDEIKERFLKLIENQPFTLKYFPNFETVRRVRQKIQNEDEIFIPTDPEVAEHRNIRAELIAELYRNMKKEEAEI